MTRIALAALVALPALARADATVAVDPVREKMALCTDGKSHYVGVGPNEKQLTQLWAGDGKRFFPVPLDESGRMSGDWFFDPRHYNKQNNDNFRGRDLRVWSHVDYDAEKKTCVLTCGARAVPLTIVDGAKAKALLVAAEMAPNPRKWTPYALARDDRGTYYYVDRGWAPGTERNFRLFVGPKGGLKAQKMTNVVSDSEGDIFSTKSGSLRLILGRGQGTWIAGKKEAKLLWVPVDENLPVIYNELGVYAGERFGTPCDDM